jgi:hypothetical protein
MLRAGVLRRLRAGLVLAASAAVGTAGCVVAYPEPFVVGPPVVVAPRPVIVAPRPHRWYYRGGYHRSYHGGHYHRGHWR